MPVASGRNGVPLLSVVDLCRSFGRRRVLDGVSFEIWPGEIVGLLGRNGAGKTTAFKITIGLLAAQTGKVFLRGQEVTGLPMYQRARMGMGYLSQEPSVFQKMTARNNLRAILEAKGLRRTEMNARIDQLLQEYGLLEVAGQKAETLSGGEQRRLEICRALLLSPVVIMLDEPFSGVDPKAVEEIQGIVRRLSDLEIAVLLTDHNVRDTLSITDRSFIIDRGRILAHGSPQEIIENPEVRKVYLGESFRM